MKTLRTAIWITIVSLVFGLLAVKDTWAAGKRYYSLGAGPPLGSWYIVAAGLTSHANEYLTDIKVITEVTGGAFENYRLLKRGELDFAESKCDLIMDDVQEKKYGGDAQEKIKLFLNSWMIDCHKFIVKKDSPIRSIKEFKGKRFAMGPHASSSRVMVIRALKTLYGYEPDKDYKAFSWNFMDGLRGLQDGTVDIAFDPSPNPSARILDLQTKIDIRFIPYTEEQVSRFQKAWPGRVWRSDIPKGTYKGQDEAVVSMGEPTIFIVSPDVPKDDAYEIFKALFTDLDKRNAFHPQAKNWNMDATLTIGAELAKFGVTFHPGVKKYLQEIGKWSAELEPK